MKTLSIIIMFAAAFVALYEQSKPQPNVWIVVGALIVFMAGMLRLMSKIPSKKDKNEGDV